MTSFAIKLALRELRGGLAGFRIFLICLILGVAGIAAVGSITAAIDRGMGVEGRVLLGGDAALRFAYRSASEQEFAWMEARGRVSETVEMRSMLGREDVRSLVQVKAVDAAYPLVGEVEVDGTGTLASALEQRNGVFGLVTEAVLADRLGLVVGDRVRLGAGTFEFRGVLTNEPDRISGGFAMGPRVLTSTKGLRAAEMLSSGTMYDVSYRLETTDDLDRMEVAFRDAFPESGVRWRDRRNAAPGVTRFVDRLGSFLILVGLAAMVTGGVGISSAVSGYLTRKVPVIAALRAQGASAGTIFIAYLIQIGLISALGILIGLAIGGGAVALLGPVFARDLPVPAEFTLYPAALGLAALFGTLVALIFTLWPLAWVREARPAALFRGEVDEAWPRPPMLLVLALVTLVLVGMVIVFTSTPKLALWSLAGIAGAFALLRFLGWALARACRWLSHQRMSRRRPSLRLALGAVGAPGAGTPGVVAAMGLGLGVLAGVGQIDANMQGLIKEQLPENSPAFFFVDIQNAQLAEFKQQVSDLDGTERIETAPMLRGIVTHLNGVPAAEAKVDPAGAWVLRGDRGVSYADRPPTGAEITEGEWWAADYTGKPLVSFAEEEGRELGLSIGSTVTLSILGRSITAEVANFRTVEWRGMGINFLMIMSPNALIGAPHTHIATLYAEPDAEVPVLRTLATEMPNVTAVLVRTQIDRVSSALGKLGAATRWAALAVLLTGLAVLIGAAAAGEERRVSEAALLKVLGARRTAILGSFALRSALIGLIAGLVALFWGVAVAWAVTTFVLDAPFTLHLRAAIVIVGGAVLVSVGAGLTFAIRPLKKRPAAVLRTAAG